MATAAREINGECARALLGERTATGERAVTGERTTMAEQAVTGERGERTAMGLWQAGGKETWWSQRREATLNWLALGVLLAAWNASGNDSSPIPAPGRPPALRGYSSVSVRAATLHAAELRHSVPST